MTEQFVAGVIGGTRFTEFLNAVETISPTTPYGATSAPVAICDVGGRSVAFLPRHGVKHEYAPHRVNYRANLWALHDLGVRHVFGPFAAGALDRSLAVGDIVIPDQLIDRTFGRDDTFYDDFAQGVLHTPFADPYDDQLREKLRRAGECTGMPVRASGTVVVIQGPRFGTRAEGDWYRSQGWHLVNMTQYPEAVLARELGMSYAGVALVTDADSGATAGAGVTQDEVFAAFDRHLDRVRRLLVAAIASI